MNRTRTVHVDDTDARFIFRGNWTAKQSNDSWGRVGIPFKSSLHESASDGAVIFRFKNASFISIYGNIDTTNNRPKPSWLCALDRDVSGFDMTAPDGRKTSHFPFCQMEIPDGGEHQLTMKLVVPLGGIVAIDAVEVAPAQGVTITRGETLSVQHNDSAIIYEPSEAWTVEPGVHESDTPGASIQFNFTGLGIQFLGVQRTTKPPSSGAYSLNDGPAQPFDIRQVDAATYNEILFTEEGLSSTNNSINVTYTGNRGDAMLGLNSFFITLPPGRSPLLSTAAIIEISEQTVPETKKPVGPIVGGVVGGLAGLTLIIVTAFFLRRYYRRRLANNSESLPTITPFTQKKPSEPVITSPLIVSSSTSGQSTERPVIPSQLPRRLHILHRDSGYRAGDSGVGNVGQQEGHVDLPPSYSP